MDLRIIKKGSARNKVVAPFHFAEEQLASGITPEAAGETPVIVDAPPEIAAEEPAPPAIDIEQLEKDAFDRGYAEGREAGLKEGLQAGEDKAADWIEEMTARYTDTLAELAALKDTLRAQVEEEVVRLALAVARKLVHREINIDPTIIHTLVRVALDRVTGKTAVTVRLNPQDCDYMARRHEDMARKEGREIRFEPDSSITQGSCIIQTETGDIDARIEEKFREVESAFFEGL